MYSCLLKHEDNKLRKKVEAPSATGNMPQVMCDMFHAQLML